MPSGHRCYRIALICNVPTAERILDATRTVLARHGERKLSMSEVSVTAGVSRPTVYRYYPTKSDLLLALARHEQRRFDETLERTLADAPTPEARLDAALEAIVEFLVDSAGRPVVATDPGFVLERMARSLPVQRAALERLLGDELDADRADALLRLAMSHFLLPSPDPDASLRALRLVAAPPGAPVRTKE